MITLEQWNAIPFGERARHWPRLSPREKDLVRDLSGLTKQLLPYDGDRVETTTVYGTKERFWVGRSSGWRPCHIMLRRIDSHGGEPCDHEYQSVRLIRRKYNARDVH